MDQEINIVTEDTQTPEVTPSGIKIKKRRNPVVTARGPLSTGKLGCRAIMTSAAQFSIKAFPATPFTSPDHN
jgi:hypothetical protein